MQFNGTLTMYYREGPESAAVEEEPIALLALHMCRTHHGLGIALVADRDAVPALMAQGETMEGLKEQAICLCDTMMRALERLLGVANARLVMTLALLERAAEDERRN